MKKYDHKIIEAKWQKYWQGNNLYQTIDGQLDNKQYILDMFPYPSAAGLHVGHPEGYTATDIYARYCRLRGLNVLHPMGWDAFGLPAENYAIKTGRHPREVTWESIDNFRKQISALGFSYDWSREINTADPSYYKWTQWLFLELYKRGLAYQKQAPVNWCPSCQTVLANEQVVNDECERCHNMVEQRAMKQWFFKITAYADKLLKDLDSLDWPSSIIEMQKNWIGKSEGAEVEFEINPPAGGQTSSIKVFTTRLDTIFGATFIVVSPELVQKWIADGSQFSTEVQTYVEKSLIGRELERIERAAKDKTGVDLGLVVKNPVSGDEIPVWVADYVLGNYGTGAIMAVPAHDERDFAFAKKFNLPIKFVIAPFNVSTLAPSLETQWTSNQNCCLADGMLCSSQEFTGLSSSEARIAIAKKIDAEIKTQYRIRDWLISRQRYWGTPIPIIYCEECKNKKYKYLLLHGRRSDSTRNFFPWLKSELQNRGYEVVCPDLPNTNDPKVVEQAEFVLNNFSLDDNTIIIGHSLGGAVALKLLEIAKQSVARVVLVDSVIYPKFNDRPRPDLEKNFDWQFDYESIKKTSAEFIDLADKNYPIITKEQFNDKHRYLNTKLIVAEPVGKHFCATQEPLVLEYALVSGVVPVPEIDLPVELSDDVDFRPTGESPLARSKSFHNVKCPKCSALARRESDTMDTFVDSSWYFLRFTDPHNTDVAFDTQKVAAWCPVDLYVGGAEHAVLHLLYSRFITKVLQDAGLIQFGEPFLKLRNQGLILGDDGQKMSKSRGNVVNPDEVIAEWGADSMRLYEMFLGPLEDIKPWNTRGIIGLRRFLEKVWKAQEYVTVSTVMLPNEHSIINRAVTKVTADIDSFSFNTAISAMMIALNELIMVKSISSEAWGVFLKLLSPFAPHITEELWEQMGNNESIFRSKWPEVQSDVVQTRVMVVQVNGKVRGKLEGIYKNEVDAVVAAKIIPTVARHLEGKSIIKIIYVPGKMVSLVVG